MATKVNLDALIPREDFDVASEDQISSGATKDTISINDLKAGEFFISSLRKPDFQRETSEWEAEKICEFIESFLDADLIPALILWRSKGSFTFVIDGSHRISALAAWINDDYGDGATSKNFYDGNIPDDQLRTADKTRSIVRRRVGAFVDYELASKDRTKIADTLLQQRVNQLGALGIRLQWVEGSSTKAEQSFFKINQKASPIDGTELRVIKARRKANGIAARAIIRSGTGHKYWSAFSSNTQASIASQAKQIYDLLFEPLLESPVKTLDLPIGGKAYSAQSLALILDLVNICNGIASPSDETSLIDDVSGEMTDSYLRKTKNILEKINSNDAGSLGLHPVVYFYSPTGRHKPASLLATVAFVQSLALHKKFKDFITIRKSLEGLLITYEYLIQQIVRHYRSAIASYLPLCEFFCACLDQLKNDSDIDKAIIEISKTNAFSFLLVQADKKIDYLTPDFSRNVKSQIFIREALAAALTFPICGGYVHKHSISIDHKKRRADGGIGEPTNGQIALPFCNTGVKN